MKRKIEYYAVSNIIMDNFSTLSSVMITYHSIKLTEDSFKIPYKNQISKIFTNSEVKNTKQIFLSVKVDIRNGRIIILSAIDNLLKGQTGQAIQNLNIMSGFSMDEGLDLTNNFP